MPVDADPRSLRRLAEAAAGRAAQVLLELYETELAVIEKTSARDLVSDADREAERLLIDILRAARPEDAVVGEESGLHAGTSGLTWTVDPLDGTSNYLAGIPHWGVAIGCEDEQGSVAGVVLDPTRDELFSAARGAGATLNGRAIEGSSCDALASAVAALGPAWTGEWYEHRAELADRLLRAIAHGRQMGSLAVDLAWTAAGRFDFFYYESALDPWDVGMRVIAEEAGLVTEILPAREGLPGALLACPPALRADLARVLGR